MAVLSAYVVWNHEEPSGSVRATDESGGQNWAAALNSAERDATGVDMNLEDPGPEPLNTLLTDENNPDIHAMGNPARLSGGCTFNHMPIPDCGFLLGGISLDRFNLVSVAAHSVSKVIGTRTITEHFSVYHNSGHEADDLENNIFRFGSDSEGSFTTTTVIPLYGSSMSFSSVISLVRAQQPQKSVLTPQQQPQKPPCKQSPNGGDVPEILNYLTTYGLMDLIVTGSIRHSTNLKTGGIGEGIQFQIVNHADAVTALANSPHFVNAHLGFEHNGQVGGKNDDFRGVTGNDPNKGTGATKSLQFDIGPDKTDPFHPERALGYADLDCDNPAQSPGHFLKHIFK